MKNGEPAYFGDGVYAQFDGYGVMLKTQRDGGWVEIYVEPEVFQTMVKQLKANGLYEHMSGEKTGP